MAAANLLRGFPTENREILRTPAKRLGRFRKRIANGLQ
jgi:hypothetical protein